MDCIVHGVAKSRTRLSDFHFHSTDTLRFSYGNPKGSSGLPSVHSDSCSFFSASLSFYSHFLKVYDPSIRKVPVLSIRQPAGPIKWSSFRRTPHLSLPLCSPYRGPTRVPLTFPQPPAVTSLVFTSSLAPPKPSDTLLSEWPSSNTSVMTSFLSCVKLLAAFHAY